MKFLFFMLVFPYKLTFPTLAANPSNIEVLNNLCYQYKYDTRNRLVEKKLPGKDWEFIVYDKLDRVVATGPVYPPFEDLDVAKKGWLITKYDAFNRVILTAWTAISPRASLQNNYNNASVFSETRTNSSTTTTINNVAFNYTTVALPTAGYHVLTVNYYDDYTYVNAPTSFTVTLNGVNQAYYNNTIKPKGMATGSWIRVLTSASSTDGEKSYTLYDIKGRPVKSYSTNYLGGFISTETKLDFVGKPIYTVTKHLREVGDTPLEIREDFTYSDQDRLLTHVHEIVGQTPPELLTQNEYNEMGQLKRKSVGGDAASGQGSLQKIDYSYNIRGWLTNINNVDWLTVNPAGDPIDLFSFAISYNEVTNSLGGQIEPLYNGNISETYWKTDSDNVVRNYGYQYDALNRLTGSIYQKDGFETNSYNEFPTYDKNGNILTMRRNGYQDSPTNPYPIDDLNYIYANGNMSNQLLVVDDSTNSTAGFKNGNFYGQDYEYDNYGNMITDRNKGISQNGIKYNHLNLPTSITFVNGSIITYLYNAVGVKLGKMISTTNTTQSTLLTDVKYLGGFQYKNNDLEFFPTAEGYVSVTYGDKFNYVYNYTDHLGNIRLSYSKDPFDGMVKILEENHYYPFGLKHSNYNVEIARLSKGPDGISVVIRPTERNEFQYKYNGKEFQDELSLNWYDYGARNYDPAIGRWMNIDPLAEIYHTDTPFAYVLNNPLSYIDPDGRRLVGVTKDDAQKLHNDLNSVFADSKFNKLRNLFSRGEKNNKTTFDKIGADALKEALSGLTGDDLALVELVTGAINSDDKHKVEYVEAGTNLSIDGEKDFNSGFSKMYTDNDLPVPNFPTRTGQDVIEVGGVGYNTPTSDGSHSFIVNDAGTIHGEGRRELTTFHEIFGHGIASAKKTSHAISNQNAIRAENLVRRVLGIQQQRDGSDHAGGKVFGPSLLPTVKN